MKADVLKVDEIIKNIARKYSRNTSISYEDFYQDLWVKAMEIDQYDLPIACITTSLKNQAINISRKNWKELKQESLFTTDSTECQEAFLFNHASKALSHNTEIDETYMAMLKIISELPERERVFVIVKAHFNSNLEDFEDLYNEIISTIPDDRKALLSEYEKRGKQEYTDDIILKVFLGIKSGTNSSSARTIKWNIHQALMSVVG